MNCGICNIQRTVAELNIFIGNSIQSLNNLLKVSNVCRLKNAFLFIWSSLSNFRCQLFYFFDIFSSNQIYEQLHLIATMVFYIVILGAKVVADLMSVSSFIK